MEFFVKIVNGKKPLTIFAKTSFLDVWLGSGYVLQIRSQECFIHFKKFREEENW